jgi:neutral amino acid transport system permease protein
VPTRLRAWLLVACLSFLLVGLLAVPALAVGTAVADTLLAQEDADVDDGDDVDDEADVGDEFTDDEDADDDEADEDEVGPGVLFGTLRAEGETVEGVELVVLDAGGDEVDRVTSDERGTWEVEVEGGDYTVRVESLPEDVSLRDPEQDSFEVSVDDGARRAVPIQLGDPPQTRGAFASVLQQLVSGLRFGLIIAMTAIGLSLVFGTTGLINFAHGDTVIFGAFAAWVFNATFGIHLLIAAPIGVVFAAGLGAMIDRGMFRPLRRRGVGLFQLLVVTIGLSLVLRYGLLIFFGGSRRQYTDFIGQEAIRWGPISQTPRNLVIMALSILVLVLVGLALQKSRMGKAMRAVADNRDLAESSGINVERVVGLVWIVGSGLAGLGGIFYGAMFSFQYISGFQLLLLMFAAIILGGLGTAFGAMLGGIVIGVVVEVSAVFFPSDLGYAWALGILILVLLFRPQGLLGRADRIG